MVDTIKFITKSESNYGSCNTISFCSEHSLFACYTCPEFMLLKEKERIAKLTDDLTVSAIDSQRIYAVSQVILACKKARDTNG
jgi:hypothetical protein